MAINQLERASLTWPVLVECAQAKKTISYGELGKAIGVHHRAIRYILEVIQKFCMEDGLPPLTILIVNSSGLPGAGFIAYDLENFDEGLNEVYDKNWAEVQNPFGFSTSGDSMQSLVQELIDAPESSSEVYTRIRSRGVIQMVFREALINAYSKQCAFTKISTLETLEACHIVPWSQASKSERLDVQNGLLLNSFHHKLFDAGLITITRDHRIVYKHPEKKNLSTIEASLTVDLHHQKIHMPVKVTLRPSNLYIERHHEIAGWEERG